jgi:hypothetical protein
MSQANRCTFGKRPHLQVLSLRKGTFVGLAGRQAMAAFKEKKFAEQLGKLKAVVGTDIAVEVAETDFTKAAIEMLPNALFDRLRDDLKKICKDDLGKQAVREAVTKVVAKFTATPKAPTVTLEGGQLAGTGKWDGTAGTDYPG